MAFAQCNISTWDADSFETTYTVTGEDAVFTTTTRIPLQDQCIEELGLEMLRQGPADCSDELTDQLYDPVYKGTGQLPAEGTCEIRYEEGHLVLHGTGTIVLFVKDEAGRKKIEFPKWEYIATNATDTLGITLPEGVEKIEYVPKTGSKVTGSEIFWAEFPAEKPEIVYTLEADYTLYMMMAIVVVALVLIAAAATKLMKRQAVHEEMDLREKEIQEQIKQAKYQYMKRQIDEPMFRKLMEGYMKEMTEIKAKKRMRK
jgi:hypothetical protein